VIGNVLGEWVKENNKLVHLDISYNKIQKTDCLILGELILQNHTLLGLHIIGNDAEVDSLGFIKQKQSFI
jgi:hypothetical protein